MAVTQLYSSDFYMNIHQSPGQDTMLFRIFSYSKRKRPYYQKFHIPEQQLEKYYRLLFYYVSVMF
ncbi:hypothetical protein [Chryseobacterium arthrosphaerae]|uniref:hypothetical protein n=1 Tax=Chryseobacterium arthrosphaerae TaxID=651561 RepID=UPI001F4A227A|nr:hypothetical protein [Chryseobacterium arthrosphaerae]